MHEMSGLFGQTHQPVGAAVPACAQDVKNSHPRLRNGLVWTWQRPISCGALLPQVSLGRLDVTDEADVNSGSRRRSSRRLLGGKPRLSIYQDALSFVSAK